MTRCLALGLTAVVSAAGWMTATAQVATPPVPGVSGAPPAATGLPAPPADVLIPAPHDVLVAPAIAGGPPTAVLVEQRLGGEAPDPQAVQLAQQDANLGAQVAALAARIKDLTDAAARADAEQQLAALVAQQFAARQALREHELAQLEAQLARLRGLHQQRAAQRDRIIADRVEQLLREAEGLGWGDASAVVGAGRKIKFRTGEAPWTVPGPRVISVTGMGDAPGGAGGEGAMDAADRAAAAEEGTGQPPVERP